MWALIQGIPGDNHPTSLNRLTDWMRKQLVSPIRDISTSANKVNKLIVTFHPEDKPGTRLIDLFESQIHHNLYLWPKDRDKLEATKAEFSHMVSAIKHRQDTIC
jgi:hypothetical protein